MNEESNAVPVEVFLQSTRLTGVYRQVQTRLRLVDVLNAEDDVLELQDVRVWLTPHSDPLGYPSMSLAKRIILAAIPRESAELRRKAALANMLTGTPRTQANVSLVLPPIAVEGTAHLSLGAGAIGLKNFAKFFAVTGATLHLAGEPSRQAEFVLVNRECIGPYLIRPMTHKLAV